MNRTVAALLISIGLLLPATLHADPPAGLPVSTSVERDILEGFSDADVSNMRRVMNPELWRQIVRNWHLKSPEQQQALQAALRDFAAQPDPQEWEAANRPSLQPRIVGATGGSVMGGVIGGSVIAATHLLALQALRAGQPLTRWMGLFFRPLTGAAGKLMGLAPRWGMIGAGVALTAAAGAAAWYGITRWMQDRQQTRDRAAYTAERGRLAARLTELASARARVTAVTPGVPAAPAVAGAPAPPGAPGIAPAPILDPDELRITNPRDGG